MKLIAGKMNVIYKVCKTGYDASYKIELNARKVLTKEVKPVKIVVRKQEGMVY